MMTKMSMMTLMTLMTLKTLMTLTTIMTMMTLMTPMIMMTQMTIAIAIAAKTQQVTNLTCTGSRNLSELSSSSVTVFFHWSKAKGNGNGGRLCSCLMV